MTPLPRATDDNDRLLSVTAAPAPEPGSATVSAIGAVDSYTAPLLEACVESQLARPGLRSLLVDLERVTFLGAAGAAVLARARARGQVRGARLVVRWPDRGIARRVLQTTGFVPLTGSDTTRSRRSRSAALPRRRRAADRRPARIHG